MPNRKKKKQCGELRPVLAERGGFEPPIEVLAPIDGFTKPPAFSHSATSSGAGWDLDSLYRLMEMEADEPWFANHGLVVIAHNHESCENTWVLSLNGFAKLACIRGRISNKKTAVPAVCIQKKI